MSIWIARRLERNFGLPARRTVRALHLAAVSAAATLFVLISTVIVAFPSVFPGQTDASGLQIGDIAPRDIHSPVTREYVSDVLTEQRKQVAGDGVRPIYDPPDPNVVRQQTQFARQILDYIQNVRRDPYGTEQQKLNDINQVTALTLDESIIRSLLAIDNDTWQEVDDQIVSVLERVMRDGTHSLREVVVETNLDLLQLGGQVDLLDTPGVGSEDRFDMISADVLRSLDAVIVVVRYPGLFTRFTRRLMDSLEQHIGKLFVVWNLDAACYDLTYDERMRHEQTLRANVTGAHDLYQVDARAALRAAMAGDSKARTNSGLDAFASALGRFASSDKREVVALREAAKRTKEMLDEAHRLLAERHAHLQDALDQARQRLEAAQRAAEAERSAARGKFADVQAGAARIGEQRDRAASDSGGRLIEQLRAARRRWARRGDAERLRGAVAEAVNGYADQVEIATQVAADELHAAVRAFGAQVTLKRRGRTVPVIDPIAPQERMQRAVQGHARWLRRALWRRWYLPGLAAFERSGLTDDLAAQAAWYESAVRAAESAARELLESRLADIDRRAEAETRQIKQETAFAANEAEHRRLTEHLPIVTTQLNNVTAISAEARALL